MQNVPDFLYVELCVRHGLKGRPCAVLSPLNDAYTVLDIWNMPSLAQRERKEGYIRDIQRLSTTPFSLVLRKEYLTVHRETLTQYITF
jgi:hypothetical protein